MTRARFQFELTRYESVAGFESYPAQRVHHGRVEASDENELLMRLALLDATPSMRLEPQSDAALELLLRASVRRAS